MNRTLCIFLASIPVGMILTLAFWFTYQQGLIAGVRLGRIKERRYIENFIERESKERK